MRSAKHNSVTRENPFHTDPGRDSDTPGSVSRGEARGGVHPGTAWPSVKPGLVLTPPRAQSTLPLTQEAGLAALQVRSAAK